MAKEDYQTKTVDAAEAFERGTTKTENDDIPNFSFEGEIDEDYCGCSDPGCPCSGRKKSFL